jgi:hypothetical protein
MEMQDEEVINENTNTSKGNICPQYMDIDIQFETYDTKMDDNKIWLNGVPNQLIDLGFENVNIKLITIGLKNMNLEFN